MIFLTRAWSGLEADAAEKDVERELHPDVEVSELAVTCGHLVKTHLVHDGLDVDAVLGEESDAPFEFIQAGGAGDELEDAARVGAADASVTCHQLAAGFKIERIPVVRAVAALRHWVKADERPVWQDGIEAVLEVVRHAVVELLDACLKFRGSGREAFFPDEGFGAVLLLGGGVFRALGLGEVRIGGAEDLWAKRETELFLIGIRDLEIWGEQHEAEVGLGRSDGKNQQVRVGRRADFLHQLGEAGFRLALFFVAEERPLGVVHMIEQVHDVPTFSGHEWGHFGGGHDDLASALGGGNRQFEELLEIGIRCVFGGCLGHLDRPWFSLFRAVAGEHAHIGEAGGGGDF